MTTTLVTGLPRSGTTLICALLNEYPDTLALAEPIRLERHGDRERAVRDIETFAADVRKQALQTGAVVTKHVGGKIPDNWVQRPEDIQPGTLRKVLEQRGEISVGKPLSDDFTLVIKHPAEFSALADLLRPKFDLVAIVRNPLDVLAAWQTVDMPVNRGHMPMAEAFNGELAALLGGIDDRIARQVALIGWLLQRYAAFPRENIIRYEDVVADPLATLKRLSPHGRPGTQLVKPFAPDKRYQAVDFAALRAALKPVESIARNFYPDFGSSAYT